MQAAFPAKRKTVNKIPKEAAAHGAGEGSEIKAAAAPPKDGGSKTEPLARKTEAPTGPRRPSMPTEASSSKGTSKKAEAKSL